MNRSSCLMLLPILLVLVACAELSQPVVKVETAPPKWSPGITIESYLLPSRAEQVEIKFEKPELSFRMYPSGSGSWRADLKESQIETLLAGQTSKVYPVKVTYLMSNGKSRVTSETKQLDVWVQDPKATPDRR